MFDIYTFSFFVKEATGMGYDYLKAKKEISKTKPDPIELDNPVRNMHRKHITGLVQPRLATKRPAMIGTKKNPINIGGNPRARLGLKRNQ